MGHSPICVNNDTHMFPSLLHEPIDSFDLPVNNKNSNNDNDKDKEK